MRRIIFCLISVIAQTNIATAVVVNIDFGIHPIFAGDPTPLPPPTYAAAGSPGIWNAISQVPTTPSGALVDINGAPLSLTLSSSVLAWSSPFPAFDADILAEDEQMLRWALVRSDGLTHLGLTLTFSNLSAGTYRITSLCMQPTLMVDTLMECKSNRFLNQAHSPYLLLLHFYIVSLFVGSKKGSAKRGQMT